MTASRRLAPAALAAAVLLLSASSDPVGAQEGGPVEEVRIVAPTGDALAEGGSATPFTLELPDGAACAGDSRDENYRVDSYMVPGDLDPTDIELNGLGPQPQSQGDYETFRHPLYDTIGTNFVSIQTADAEQLGDPGLILDIPDFDLDVYSPGHIQPGRYHLGIACSLRNEVQHAWDAQIDVTVDASDAPAQIHWRTVGFQPDDDAGSPLPLILGGIGVVGAIAIVATRARRRPGRTPTPQRRNP